MFYALFIFRHRYHRRINRHNCAEVFGRLHQAMALALVTDSLRYLFFLLLQGVERHQS